MAKKRLDVLLVEKGFAESRERAKSIIMEGNVLVDESKIDKCGTLVKEESKIRLLKEDFPFVSRGGLKLKKAIESFNIKLENKTAADIGASTGGFTDCMLQNKAAKVYAIDVGYGQLAWKLRQDERVVNMERTNIRYVTEKDMPETLDFISIDVAFISLKKVLLVAKKLLKDDGKIVALIKPQFEAGRENVGKKGVVKDANIHMEVINDIITFCKEENLSVIDLTFSPIKGSEGNIEYLIYLEKNIDNDENSDRKSDDEFCKKNIEITVRAAHENL